MEQNTVFQHETSVQIRFNDIDLMGHVNNATIQEYFDLGRMHYLRQIFGERLFINADTLIIASITTDFMVPVLLLDQVAVRTAVVHIGNKSLKMEQQIVDVANDTVKVICRSVMVGVNKDTGNATPIVQEWRDAIGQMEQRTF
ncbi:MAG: acyl-CoA thioesterase [Marinilabiliaceae bacterium]|nr:acyl-CoA thioesterase [Marinilabiliaceae bacterium]MBI9065307.1 acyl-CoA thioesterase [Marinilabiliaceae bacterium]